MRLIDADALKHAVSNIDMHGRSEQFYEIMGVIAEVLSSAPTIDAEPVRHGLWTSVEYRPHVTGHHCSVCRYVTFSRGNYCPNCGAMMDTTRAEATDTDG